VSLKNIVFDLLYRFGKPPWVIDAPQPALMAAVSQGVIRGPSVLDVGCGTGDNAVYLAECGFSVTGVDVSTAAIALAERKARTLSVKARFVPLDAFQLVTLATKFETVLDFGLFHQFAGATRARYVRALGEVCTSRGQLLLQCFSDHGGKARWFGPRLVSQEELRAAFSERWRIEWIRPASYKSNRGREYPAWLALMTSTNSE
jgi:cyclopropane fatty-acyl-phospholipid synthase-like methyltransferase